MSDIKGLSPTSYDVVWVTALLEYTDMLKFNLREIIG